MRIGIILGGPSKHDVNPNSSYSSPINRKHLDLSPMKNRRPYALISKARNLPSHGRKIKHPMNKDPSKTLPELNIFQDWKW
ncbi:hypothetical protein AXX17_AT1G11410 [Arabidopsis thaliana]|jgi:hypothetical protein|uniref:Uncharacterized protein n=1 Tax=Arabidopsis thaliana TaxID=3702 RepID=A0A178WGY3_ARATH|nr:hypothetical protein AXX17_AT1G11410 [Arabidopsis thaliana]